MDLLAPIVISSWQPALDTKLQTIATKALESGKVLFLPQLNFPLTAAEYRFLDPDLVDPRSKNISFNPLNQALRGCCGDDNKQQAIKSLLNRFATSAQGLLKTIIPHYQHQLQIGRTSLRLIEVAGRKNPSYRKDDTRLHVDAFPATPNQGRRILRIFTNINPEEKPRLWRLGESFSNVAERFVPWIAPPRLGSSWLLQQLKITKGKRTAYDHYMLAIHDNMKADSAYQATVNYQEVNFPANSTWIVYTDQVSHAALAGQHLLEQTFYLPVTAMQNPALSPLRILEKQLNKGLV